MRAAVRKMFPVIRGGGILNDSGEKATLLGERNWILQLGKGCQDPPQGGCRPFEPPRSGNFLRIGILCLDVRSEPLGTISASLVVTAGHSFHSASPSVNPSVILLTLRESIVRVRV